MGASIPKQFLLLHKRPLLFYTIEKFAERVRQIILVLPQSHLAYWRHLCESFEFNVHHTVVKGGVNRTESVMNGLNELEACDVVAIHDAVRPLVTSHLIDKLFEKAVEFGNAVPYIPCQDSLRQINNDENKAVNRTDFVLIQTPQCFNYQGIISAYNSLEGVSSSDDASVFEKAGNRVHLVEGERTNFKITYPEDLQFAEFLIQAG